jgi:hypothetical protein
MNLDSAMQDLSEWFSPIQAGKRRTWRQDPDSSRLQNIEVTSTDLQAALVHAISMLKEEVSGNRTGVFESKQNLESLMNEIQTCSYELDCSLKYFRCLLIFLLGPAHVYWKPLSAQIQGIGEKDSDNEHEPDPLGASEKCTESIYNASISRKIQVFFLPL